MGKETEATQTTEFNAEETIKTIAADVGDIGDTVKELGDSALRREEFDAHKEELGNSIAEIKADQAENTKKFESFVAKQQTIDVTNNGPDHIYEDGDKGFVQLLQDTKAFGRKFTGDTNLSGNLKTYAELCEKKYGLQVGDDTAGGFLIPQEQRDSILSIADEGAAFRNMAFSLPIRRSSQKIPYASVTSLASGGIAAGLRVYWEAEESTATASSKEFDALELNLYKLFGLMSASGEWVDDAPEAAAVIARDGFATAINWETENAMINGIGAGSPRGVLNESTKVSVTRSNSNLIDLDDVENMWMRMYSASQANAVWLYNQSCWKQLMNLSLPVGTGGSGVMMMNAAQAPLTQLFGRPLIPTQHCQALGTEGDLILVDWKQYVMASKGPKFAESIHLYFDSDRTAYRMIFRVDGRGWWKSALTPAHGNDTLTWCVTLAA